MTPLRRRANSAPDLSSLILSMEMVTVPAMSLLKMTLPSVRAVELAGELVTVGEDEDIGGRGWGRFRCGAWAVGKRRQRREGIGGVEKVVYARMMSFLSGSVDRMRLSRALWIWDFLLD